MFIEQKILPGFEEYVSNIPDKDLPIYQYLLPLEIPRFYGQRQLEGTPAILIRRHAASTVFIDNDLIAPEAMNLSIVTQILRTRVSRIYHTMFSTSLGEVYQDSEIPDQFAINIHYPQTRKETLMTLIHEVGHIFYGAGKISKQPILSLDDFIEEVIEGEAQKIYSTNPLHVTNSLSRFLPS